MRWLALPALLMVAGGCSETVAVHVVSQPDVRMLTAREDGGDARIYAEQERVADACREVGDVFLGDTAFTGEVVTRPTIRRALAVLLVLGGFIGMLFDLNSGAAWTLRPDPLHVVLEPMPAHDAPPPE